jgi:hypothetical protein
MTFSIGVYEHPRSKLLHSLSEPNKAQLTFLFLRYGCLFKRANKPTQGHLYKK